MSYDKYMIVNATQLDADLASIAEKIKTKLNETGEYNFPEDFLTAIDKMVYDANPNSEADLIVNEDTVTATSGYYPSDVSKSVATGSVIINSLEMESNPSVTLSDDGLSIVSEYSVESSPTVHVATRGYVTSSEITAKTCKASGITTKPLSELLIMQDENSIIGETNKVTIPAGYYANEVIITPSTYLEAKGEADIINNADGTITIPAGYYATNVLYTLPANETPTT